MKHLTKPIVFTLLVLTLSACSYNFLVRNFSAKEAMQTQRTAEFFAQTIDNTLRRLEHLPFVISQDHSVSQALARGDGALLNPLLKSFASRADADHIFLMDLNGKTIAASNYESSNSFIGKFYTFRPYFRDAVTGQTGRFYAIGATTGKPGYFVSAPVTDAFGVVSGVIVVKTGLQSLNSSWQKSGLRILVSNTDSVIVLASDQKNQFRTLLKLTVEQRENLEQAQQFGNQALTPLDWVENGTGQVKLDGREYLLAKVETEQEAWTLHLLIASSEIRQRAALVVAGILALLFAVIVTITGSRSVRLKRALRKSNDDRARLTHEIEVRRAAETDLKIAETELERSSKLAALGQLSASITHELAQPISAMRNHLAAEEIAVNAEPNSLHPLLSGLVDRMQNINDQLRGFAAPSIVASRIFDLRQACDAASELVSHEFGLAEITIAKHFASGPVNTVGSQQQVEQVLTNLLRNAIDAVTAQEIREITISVNAVNATAFVKITDTGPGLEGRTITDMQEPFMTTKASGLGMGLGLAISAQIAKDMSGYIEARDTKAGGAEFTLWLPLTEELT